MDRRLEYIALSERRISGLAMELKRDRRAATIVSYIHIHLNGHCSSFACLLRQGGDFSMLDFKSAYLAAGGNRHPSAADWDPRTGLLAFGADRNVALWSPLVLLFLE